MFLRVTARTTSPNWDSLIHWNGAMSNRHLLLAVTLVAAHAAAALAQNGGATALVAPHHFSNDHQYFAPAVWEDLGQNRKPNTGWFAQLSRMRVLTGRQTDGTRLVGPDGADWSWGYRADVGFMTEANHGWAFSAMDINNSGDGFSLFRRPQLNRLNEDELALLEDPETEVTLEDLLPPIGLNNQFTNTRAFDQITTFNSSKLTSFEGMKSWRFPAFHRGGYIEPMVGMRYVKLRDMTSDDKYLRFTEDEFNGGRDNVIVGSFPNVSVNPGPVSSFTPALVLDPDQLIEQLVYDDAYWLNHMVLAQIGFRMKVPQGRFTLNHEAKAFCGQNWQEYSRIVDTYSLLYDGVGDGSEIIQDEVRRNRLDGNDSEFVFGAEARAEAAYHLTRDVMLNAGVQYTYLAQGVGRGNDIFQNEQDFGQFSFIFGFVYNR